MKELVVDAPRTAGRPRSARAHDAIIDAVLDLLVEGTPLGELSIEAIAARAGVGKATIYRRWAGKNDLLLDAVRTLKTLQPLPAGRSVRDDLVQLMTIVNVNADPRAAQVFPCLIPQILHNPELRGLYQQVVEPRRERTREVLRRGIANGELRPDIDVELATLLLTGPIMFQRMLGWNPNIDEAMLPERIVDAVLAGIGARPAGESA
jgi:AcrR family transcriptional regulator